jgi:uncharacterized membrane protein YhhN
MFNIFFFIAMALALVDWIGTGLGWKRRRYFTKGATMVALITWFTSVGGWHDGWMWFGAGLIFGLIGDVALQLSDRFFMVGLAAFLVGHLSYIAGFVAMGIALQPQQALIGAVLVVGATLDFVYLRWRMKRNSLGIGVRAPALIYGGVITVMALCAMMTLANPSWSVQAALCCAVGAGFFLVSDMILAFEFFATPLRYSKVIVMITYHIAQFLIMAGVLQYLM